MVKKTLVIVTHPNMDKSRVNKSLMNAILNQENITVHQLYKEYPDFKIDVEKEQKLLLEHDNIVLQFPFQWYSVPALLKQWFDDVLSYGFAYGKDGDKLKGKKLQLAVSTGGAMKYYNPQMFETHPKMEPLNDLSIPYLKPEIAKRNEGDTLGLLLKPLEQMAYFISMDFQKSFITYGAIPMGQSDHAIKEECLVKQTQSYLDLIKSL